jgi:ATP-dependent helicase HepA
MEVFFPDQRWTSKGEPELGVGIVKEVSDGRVQVHFSVSGELRMYAIENAPLRRVRFKPGDTVVDSSKQPLQIESVQEDGALITYFGQGRALSESELGDVSVNHGVDDRLSQGDVETPEVFALRRQTLELDHKRRISPVNGFIGGRIDLIPHQLYIAHEVSQRYAPRVLLSDQVGLGKTIEACLILHRLLLSGRISRVLILVPDSLIHQWFVELLRRFNLWFHIFDKERCAAIEAGAPDGNPFLEDQLIICSTSFLANSPTRTRQALSASWDMLVVDEAHHLEWSVDKVSPKYGVVELLSKVAKGLLLLTATPEQLGVESHFARLRLLDPERYSEYHTFINESREHREIANVVEALADGKPMKPADKKLLKALFGEDRIARLSAGSDSVRDNLIEDLLDQHGPGRVVFRNTRSAMRGFPKRKAHLVPIETADERWVQRLSKEFSADMKPSAGSPEPQFWFGDDPRVDWLLKFMKALHPAKVLLICRSKEKVLALEKALGERGHLKVGVFHEDLTIVQRDWNAAWFSEQDGVPLLLCSEIGSEGRNFQFAHHLVLFDLPLQPELLEQRIGRLDRIGQTQDIHIHIPYLTGTPQAMLVRWYHEGLHAFEDYLEGGNEIMQIFGDRLLSTSLSAPSENAKKQLEALIADTAVFQQALKAKLAKGRDRLLEMNSFRPKVAEKLVDQIQAEDQDARLEIYMTKVFSQFSIEIEDLAPRTYLLHRPPTDSEVFPSIPDAGISITFDRKRALSREDISFISRDHPMTTGAIDMILSLGKGSASFGVLKGTDNPGLLLELLFVLETAGEQRIYVDRFLPNTPLRVIVDHTGKDVTALYQAHELDQALIPGQIEALIQNEHFTEAILPSMISAATKVADTLAAAEISRGLQKMNLSLDHEIERMQSLQKKNENIRPEEIQAAVNEQATLAALIQDARIRLDALQLIRML